MNTSFILIIVHCCLFSEELATLDKYSRRGWTNDCRYDTENELFFHFVRYTILICADILNDAYTQLMMASWMDVHEVSIPCVEKKFEKKKSHLEI